MQIYANILSLIMEQTLKVSLICSFVVCREDSFLFTNDSVISQDNAKKDSMSENNTTIISKSTKVGGYS